MRLLLLISALIILNMIKGEMKKKHPRGFDWSEH